MDWVSVLFALYQHASCPTPTHPLFSPIGTPLLPCDGVSCSTFLASKVGGRGGSEIVRVCVWGVDVEVASMQNTTMTATYLVPCLCFHQCHRCHGATGTHTHKSRLTDSALMREASLQLAQFLCCIGFRSTYTIWVPHIHIPFYLFLPLGHFGEGGSSGGVLVSLQSALPRWSSLIGWP